MSNSGADNSKPTSPIRSRHQVTRSITEVQSFPKIHHHFSHHHSHSHHRKDKDDKIPQSALPNLQPNGLIEATKSEAVTPEESRNASRTTSVFSTSIEGIEGLPGTQRHTVKEGDVKKNREKGMLRATELRNVLLELNARSNSATRRLDNTYYSVLEKLSLLQSTINSLKELATMTRQLNDDFKVESEELVAEVETQLDAFHGLEEQQKKIRILEQSVKKGREKIETLASRVDVIRKRVEGWERGEVEWQEKARKRLKLLWILMSLCAAVFTALVVFQYTPARTQRPEGINGFDISSLAGDLRSMEEIRNDTWTLKTPTTDALGADG